jgi:hypothetical protein
LDEAGGQVALWAGTGGDGAKLWMSVLTDLHNRGVRDVFFVICDGLKGLPEVVGDVWPQTTVQTSSVDIPDTTKTGHGAEHRSSTGRGLPPSGSDDHGEPADFTQARISATEHRSSTGTSTVDRQTIFIPVKVQVRTLV